MSSENTSCNRNACREYNKYNLTKMSNLQNHKFQPLTANGGLGESGHTARHCVGMEPQRGFVHMPSWRNSEDRIALGNPATSNLATCWKRRRHWWQSKKMKYRT